MTRGLRVALGMCRRGSIPWQVHQETQMKASIMNGEWSSITLPLKDWEKIIAVLDALPRRCEFIDQARTKIRSQVNGDREHSIMHTGGRLEIYSTHKAWVRLGDILGRHGGVPGAETEILLLMCERF